MKYIATIWKNPLDLNKVEELIEQNVDILRIKWAHISTQEVLNVLKDVYEYIIQKGSDAKILLDMPEVKVRVGEMNGIKQNVVSQKEYLVKAENSTDNINAFIPFPFGNFTTYFSVGDTVFIGDGELQFTVQSITSDNEMLISFLQSGELCQYRGLFSERLADSFDHVTSIVEALSSFKEIKPAYIALSFVNSATYVHRVKDEIIKLYDGEWMPKIVAKIESQQGLDNAEEIMKASDMVVVARGDLALTTSPWTICMEQKRLCLLGQTMGVPVIVATQILDSCLTQAIPSRADIADITNIVLDGAQGIWLSKATAHADHPGKTIQIAQNIFSAINTYE